ncbi:putative redox-active protein [Sporotomaculum syntrophicum]|uniref:Redox-active protein n=1 Tax=Sporotomaculum syntrophicum TaxID=182264 RepID=A0A9D2WMJ3_9FIRM|nr:C-GCAxxG-C-C family protein [Sporotomaculum syntrophicum]KAF1084024.1 putative redox-active protein [Sporotomaculum syntrophicum]
MKELIKEKAGSYFAQGNNCCQGVLMAANDVWHLEISRDVIDAAFFMREGMASGCSCGALVGMEMTLGLLLKKKGIPYQKEHAKALHDAFVKTFGSSCCRVLRKKQGLLERTTQKGCRRITAETAGILYDFITEIGGDPRR